MGDVVGLLCYGTGGLAVLLVDRDTEIPVLLVASLALQVAAQEAPHELRLGLDERSLGRDAADGEVQVHLRVVVQPGTTGVPRLHRGGRRERRRCDLPVEHGPQAGLAAAHGAELAGAAEHAVDGQLTEEVGEVAGVAHAEGPAPQCVERHAGCADEELLVDPARQEDEVRPARRRREHQRGRRKVAEDDGARCQPGHDRVGVAHLGEGDVEALVEHRAGLQRGGQGRDSLTFAGVSAGERRAHAVKIAGHIRQRNAARPEARGVE